MKLLATIWTKVRTFGVIWPATLLLFVISPLVAPGSLNPAPILSMLPFAAILAMASLGQGIVVQQRGFDLAVPASMSLGALLVTKVANQNDSAILPAVIVALVAVAIGGALSGIAVTKLRITPIVATLGVNALMLGFIQWYSNGFPTGAAPALSDLALQKTLGIPNILILAVAVLVVAGVLSTRTLVGRRLAQVGSNAETLRLIGDRTDLRVIQAYAMAGVCYGLAGIAVAGYTQTPGIFVGDSYLLPTVAAVVLAGNSLSGGQLRVASIGIAALFLSQLNQLVLSIGAPTSAQLLIQSVVLVLAVSGSVVIRRIARARKRTVIEVETGA
jgi:ribose transport system permease protein